MINCLNSIEEIKKVIETNGSRPVVVFAEDLEYYACKYDSSTKLINEYLAHRFLQVWGITTFPSAFIQVLPQHISPGIISNRTQPHHFDKPSFGLQYVDEALDLTNLMLGLKGNYNELKKYSNRMDLLKIALFDLWLANTDRNGNNYNLLVHAFNGVFKIIPIDHADIFDGCNLGREIAQLTSEDSVLSSDLAALFLYPKASIANEVNDLLKNFHNFVFNCGKLLPFFIEEMPQLWCSDKNLLTKQVKEGVIENPAWLTETEKNFRVLVETYIC